MLSVCDAPRLLTCSSPLYARATPRAERSADPHGRTRSGLPAADRCCGRRSRPHARFGIAETRACAALSPRLRRFGKRERAGQGESRGAGALCANRFIP